ncbi:ABC transporter permease [Acidicapsa acidisoli]|uniref:ABC transporter permease n=1 Tax=Acidicapsa acidisoli TaxID=1615681 RepID=UPI0021E09F1B|nr:ABC transporter permease [Acidicapsa acidisoli]
MRDMILIAKREYLEQVRGRAFRMTTILVPAAFALIIGIGYLSSRGLGSHKHIVIAANDAALATDIRRQMMSEKDAKTTVDVIAPANDADRAELLKQVQSKAIDGYLSIETPADSANGLPVAKYISQSSGDFTTTGRLRDDLNNAIVSQHLTKGGVTQADADALNKGVKIATFTVKKDGTVVKSNAVASFYKGYVMAILLSMTTVMYGLNVARSIIQEKTSRIFEVMLSIAKPGDLLSGKLIGVGLVGLTQILIWVAAAAAIVATPLAAAQMTGDFAVHFSWTEGILFPVYFVLGYFLYSSLFAGLAATCETEQELQMYTPLAAVPIWLSFAMIMLIINDSNSFWSVAISFFPPCTPIIMFLRMGSEIPPIWQFAVSIALMLLSIWGVLWVSSRLYRVGILMYGKRATLPEILRWIRYS